jgi:peroxiredoxin Q/BCP
MTPRASDTLDTGQAAPDFTLPDPDGTPVTRSVYQSGRPLLLFFFRGTWCMQCRKQLSRLRGDAPLIAARGVALLGVAAQKRHRLKAFLDAHPLPFPILADESRAVTQLFGVYVTFNLESFRIARPATFLIDAGGIIRFQHVGTSQFDRPRPAEIMAALDRLD